VHLSGYQDWLYLLVLAIIAVSVVMIVVYSIYVDKHEFTSNLPIISHLPFVGREKEVSDLIGYLDHGAPERIINIHGSPGFGKSHLAVYVGWRMFEKGVNVYYIDLTDVPEVGLKDYFVETIYNETVSFSKFLRIIRTKYFDHLVIFDNSDDVIRNQRKELQTIVQDVVKNSEHFKFIITSREKISFIDHFEPYKVHELSKEAACNLLEYKIPNSMKASLSEREELAELTGSIPLALKIIGSLLRLGIPGLTSPSAILAELKIEPISTLSHKQLHDNTISASFNLSYRFLEKDHKVIGQLLSNFPGSFTLEAYIMVLNDTVGNDVHIDEVVLQSLVGRSLLEYTNDRYHFHSLIRDYFKMQEESAAIEWFTYYFRNYYFCLLTNATDMYRSQLFKSALAIVNEEKHNFLHLLKDLELGKIRCDLNTAIMSIVNAIEAKLLANKFSHELLLSVLEAYLTRGEIYGNYPLFKYYEVDLQVLYHVIEIQYETNSPEAAKEAFDKYDKYLMYNNSGMSRILSLVSNICSELGQHNESIRLYSYVKIFLCDDGKCSYKSFGRYHKRVGDYKLAAYYYNLSLTVESHGAIEKLYTTLVLHEIYLGLTQKSDLLDKIELTEIITMPPYELFQNVKDLNEIINYLHNHNKAEAAEILEECVANATITMDAEVDVAHVVTVLQARYKRGQCQNVVDLGQRAIEYSIKYNQSMIYLLVLVGKANIWHWNFSEGFNNMETALNLALISNDNFDDYWTCCFYLIPRLKYIKICFLDHLFSPVYLLLKWIVHATFVLPLQPLQPITEPVTEDPLSEPERFQPSSKDIVALNAKHYLMPILNRKFHTITYLGHETIKAMVNVLLLLLENQVVRFMINVASVFFRLNIVTLLMSMLSLTLTHLILVVGYRYFEKTALSGFCSYFIFNHKHILPTLLTCYGALSTILECYISVLLFFNYDFVVHFLVVLFGPLKCWVVVFVLQFEVIFIPVVRYFGYIQSEALYIIWVMHLLWIFLTILWFYALISIIFGSFLLWPLHMYIHITRSFEVRYIMFLN
jgi:hypothetical protein